MPVRNNYPPEHAEQVVLLHWWEAQARAKGIDPEHLFAIPNGGNRNAKTGARLKAEGVRAGVPDLMLAIPNGAYGGLFIEMKRQQGGKLGKKQKNMLAILSRAGYAVRVCYGFEDAKNTICLYLGWKTGIKNTANKARSRYPRPWTNWGIMDDENVDADVK